MSVRAGLRRLVPRVPVPIRHVEPGLRFWVDARRQLGLVLRGARSYEPGYTAALRELVSPGVAVVDVGANVGFYTMLFAHWAGAAGRVVAYEPDPANLRLLGRNAPATAVVRPCAVADARGESTFTLDRSTGYTGHLGEGVSYADRRMHGAPRSIRVPTVTLDEDLAALAIVPHLIKIDIEGGESAAIQGALRTLSDARPFIVTELSEWGESGAAARLLALLRDAGYVAFDLDRAQPVNEDMGAWMALAVPEERAKDDSIARALRAAVMLQDGR